MNSRISSKEPLDIEKQSIAIIGYDYGGGGTVPGCRFGPKAMRDGGLFEKLQKLNSNTVDLGDINADFSGSQKQKAGDEFSPRELSINKAKETLIACRDIYSITESALSQGATPLLLGGDHSMSIGSVAAVSDFYAKQDQSIGLIWIDTHSDCNTPETSPSKNPFGMSVAFLLGEIQGAFSRLQKRSPSVTAENLVYVGLREVDQGEKDLIKRKNITAYTMKEIDQYGIGSVINEAIEIASTGTAGFAVSFDLDVCDPRIVPGIGTPARGGLSYREAHLALELLHESSQMLSFELVELNPELDRNSETAELAISLIESAFGKSIL